MVVIKEIQEEKESVSCSTILDHRYEVFLSFRGEDTRLGFTDHLHKALMEADISTFLDDDCIQTGDDLKPELENAIQQSRASVIVLSENYASSTWCLNELVLILEQHRHFGMILLPIFYHVDPSHVRKQEESYAEAMKKHEKGIEAETDPEKKLERIRKLKLWKDALKEVADIKGKDIKGWHETRFIQQIVTEIESRVERKASSNFKDFIGMLSHVQDIESWLKDESEQDVDIITICGMGGIGKTTLARYIYEKNYRLFENSCFLKDIRKIFSSVIPDGKLSLQIQLLKDIKGMQNISSVDEGTNMIERVLMRKRVLLVLDDIDSVEQLDALLGTKGFHSGSKIIITTKDRLLPTQCEVLNTESLSKNYTEHLLKGLSMNDSLELLSRHAFRCHSPKEGFEEPSKMAIKYCGGHPLALKVLGSSLFRRDVAAWEDTLQLLEEESNIDIHSVLKISFDSLSSENDKKLFKFIACFFVGKDTDYIGKIMKECGIKTSSGIPNLVDKCLLTIDVGNWVEMHQLLQDMGRHIVHQESLAKPWKRSILCCHKEAINVLTADKGTEKTQGLLLENKILFENEQHKNPRKRRRQDEDEDENEENLKTESFTKMKNLKLLQLNFIHLKGSYVNLPKRLRWLCWHGFPSQYIPLDLPLNNLVVLDMSHSNLEGLWKVPKSLSSLKILDLRNSLKLIRTGDFSGVPNLERLILAGCANLVEISESVMEFHELELLDLSYCVKLTNLPRNMRKLSKTKTLRLDGCCNLFKTLVVPQNPQSSLLLLPRSIVKLNLSGNNLYNESFPVDFSSLSLLMHLNLSGNPMDSLPDCVKSLSRIEVLDIYDCENLKLARDLPSSINTLMVDGCGSLEVITFQSDPSELEIFSYVGCDKLKEAQFFFKLEPMAKVGKTITDRLGWSGLGFLGNQEAIMLYERSIFSTYFPDNQVPHWFTIKTNGSSISFTLPPSPGNHYGIRGLNVCFVKTISLYVGCFSTTIIINMSSNERWVYSNTIEQYSKYEDIVLMTHWIFEKNELNVGDEVYIHHFIHREECYSHIPCCNPLRYIREDLEFEVGDEEFVEHCKNIKGCGVDIVYDDHNSEFQDTRTDPLDYYKSWNDRIGWNPVDVEFCPYYGISYR